MIYTAQSRALACLENVVHRNPNGLQKNFKVIQIFIPDDIISQEKEETNLIPSWKEFDNMSDTQSLSDQWISQTKSVILKVQSVIVSGDPNYLLNPGHSDYKKIILLKTDPFEVNDRIKENM